VLSRPEFLNRDEDFLISINSFTSPTLFSSQEEDGKEAVSKSKQSRKIDPLSQNLLQKKPVSGAKLDPDVRVSWSGDRLHAVVIPKDAPNWRKIFIRGNQVCGISKALS
jgi:hypothetical protein